MSEGDAGSEMSRETPRTQNAAQRRLSVEIMPTN